MFYYKQIDENGEIVSVLACDTHLRESDTQIEITKEEYDQIIASMPEPEVPEPPEYTIAADEIDAAYREGVQEA